MCVCGLQGQVIVPCVSVCVRESVCVCVRERERERERMGGGGAERERKRHAKSQGRRRPKQLTPPPPRILQVKPGRHEISTGQYYAQVFCTGSEIH